MRRETIRNSAVSLYQRAIERSLAGKRGKSSNGLLRNSTYRSLLKVRDGLPICPQGELTCCRGPIFRPKLAKFLSYKKIIFLGTSGNASLRNFVFKPGSDGFGYRILIRANKTRAPQRCLLFSARCGFFFKRFFRSIWKRAGRPLGTLLMLIVWGAVSICRMFAAVRSQYYP